MKQDSRHLSDRDLVLAIDGELPANRVAAVEAHLGLCEACRARMATFETSAADFQQLYTDERYPRVAAGAARARLAVDLSEESRHAPQNVLWFARGRQSWLQAAAMIAVVILGARLLSRGPANTARADDLPPGILPISQLTPGAARAVTVEQLCTGAFEDAPPIPQDVRQEVLKRYGVGNLQPHEYELDYLITPELGGTSDPKNLWPERYTSGAWNAHVKDELEDLLPQLVCAGSVSPAVAQRDMATNWIAAYKKYFHTDRPRRSYSWTPDDLWRAPDAAMPAARDGNAPWFVALASLPLLSGRE